MPAWLITVLKFSGEHQAVLAAFAVALLDLLFAIKPDWKSNGVLHALYVKFGPKPPAQS